MVSRNQLMKHFSTYIREHNRHVQDDIIEHFEGVCLYNYLSLLVIPEAMQTMCVANLEGLTLISTVDRDSLQSHLKSSVYQAFFLFRQLVYRLNG